LDNLALDFTGVLDADIFYVWPLVSSMLEPALGEGETLDEVFASIAAHKAQLWIAANNNGIDMACVTELVQRGERFYCNIWLTGGTGVNNWIHFLDTVEEWAKEQGCDAMLIAMARPGWKRLLKSYKTQTISLTKEL
jgi:hypothetical protein